MLEIAGHRVGPGEPCYIVAEAGVNHNGRIDLAFRLVDAAKRVGADCVKFQTWSTERIVKADTPMYRAVLPLELSHGQFRAIKAYCDEVGITFLSTPDDEQDADFLDGLGVPAFKIGSANLRNIPFLRHVAGKGKPILLSTGMGSLKDVEAAYRALGGYSGTPVVILHCCSVYPPLDYDDSYRWWDPAMVNLRAMDTLREASGVPIGFSDHSPVNCISLAAVARGACVIERHLRLEETRGPDHYVSIDEGRFSEMVWSIRQIEAALGDGVKRPAEAEKRTMEDIAGWRKGVIG